jgi:aspartyl-tRNA(Asn)/glutamyl-tRNA(Gln) amidotransferase subunit A
VSQVIRRIVAGSFVLSRSSVESFYMQALRVRALVSSDFDRAFESCDVLLAPTSATAAPSLSDIAKFTPTQAFANDVFTVPFSLAGSGWFFCVFLKKQFRSQSLIGQPGLPVISIPAGLSSEGLPLGVQIVGKVAAFWTPNYLFFCSLCIFFAQAGAEQKVIAVAAALENLIQFKPLA